MGVIKDAFFLEGKAVKAAWDALQAAGKIEGINKQKGPKAILAERPDIFLMIVHENGHPLISVQEGAKTFSPDNGLPARGLIPVLPRLDEPVPAAGEGGEKRDLEDGKLPAAKKSKNKHKEKGAGKGGGGTYIPKGGAAGKSAWTPVRGPGGYMDIVWTPERQAKLDGEVRNETRLVWALFDAIQSRGALSVPVSTLGGDWKVAQLKKENQFKNLKLIDILKSYDKLFLLQNADTGSVVSMTPGAEEHLPEPDEELALEINQRAQQDLMLPLRITTPMGVAEKMQAVRIDIMHLLSQRSNRIQIQEIGQDPHIQKKREGVAQAKKLQDFVKLFPGNFGLTNEEGVLIVTLLDCDVSDQSMILHSIRNNQASYDANRHKYGKGGYGGGYHQQQRAPTPNMAAITGMAVTPGLQAPLLQQQLATYPMGFDVLPTHGTSSSQPAGSVNLGGILGFGTVGTLL